MPATTRHFHLANEASLGLKDARKLASACQGVNAKTAIVVPAVLGSMPFFWICVVLALCSLPAILAAFDTEVLSGALGLHSLLPGVIQKASLIALIAWVAQTFIQLVALPVLQVSNNAQMAQTEEHTAEILKGVSHAEDLLDLRTSGGLAAVQKDLAKRIDAVADLVQEQAPAPEVPTAAKTKPVRVSKK